MNTKELALLVAEAITDKKGFNLKVLQMEGVSGLADYFILANGNSRTQTQAIADNVEKMVLDAGEKISRREGYAEGSWILLDLYSVIVHIFQEEARNYYNLERLWKDAPEIPVQE